MKGKRTTPIREVALALLTRRDHSGSELARKLRSKGFTQAEVETEVARLRESGLVDERRVAEAVIEREVSSGKSGPALLRAKLAAKGIAQDVIDECLGALPSEWEREQAHRAALRWAARRRREGSWRQSLARHLRGRGFGWDAVRDAMRALGAGDEEVNDCDEP